MQKLRKKQHDEKKEARIKEKELHQKEDYMRMKLEMLQEEKNMEQSRQGDVFDSVDSLSEGNISEGQKKILSYMKEEKRSPEKTDFINMFRSEKK